MYNKGMEEDLLAILREQMPDDEGRNTMLDFRITTFLKLCETRSYTKTAKLLDITQPSVTQHIKYLQKKYGCKLFTYESKTLQLTREGEYLRRQAESMMRMSEKVAADLARMNAPQLTLRFGCPAEIGAGAVSRIVSQMLAEDPELRIELHVGTGAQLLEEVEHGRLDFVLTDKQSAPSTLGSTALARVRFQGYADPKTAEEVYGLSLKRLVRERLLLGAQGAQDRRVLGILLEKRGLGFDDFRERMLVDAPAAQQELAAAGRGLLFTYETALQEGAPRLQQLYISDLSEERPLVFLYRKDNLSLEQLKAFFERFKALWTQPDAAGTK